ncbi:MAG: 3-oxoacyl-[acyl-carrier-protein] reductase [Candidatus Pelagibacter sp.]
MINLKGLNIILTGATGGIGNSILEKLLDAKANVVATGTNENKLNEIKNKHESVKTEKFDISEHKEIENFINKISDQFENKIDVLINNAGVTRDNLSIRMKEEEWKKVIDINLTSTFLLSKNVIKKMLKNKKGKIINITSVVGHTGNIGQANYTASKAAVVAMSKSFALEYGKKNINVNCVSPGFIETEMTSKINENYRETLKSRIPLDRFGDPKDVANTVIFLCSNLSDYITGETIHVNGGMYFS